MKKIELTQNKQALVDDDDLEWLSRHKWSFTNDATGGRAVRGIKLAPGVSKLLYMHREIVIWNGHQIPHKMEVDHIDGNGLNNQKCNLRIVSSSINKVNKMSTSRSGYRGVYRKGVHYYAQIKENGRTKMLGSFDNPIDAAKAFDAAALRLYGNNAVLNFPNG